MENNIIINKATTAQLRKLISEQKAWMEICGGTLKGYVARYAYYGNPNVAKIYEADYNALLEYQEKYRSLLEAELKRI